MMSKWFLWPERQKSWSFGKQFCCLSGSAVISMLHGKAFSESLSPCFGWPLFSCFLQIALSLNIWPPLLVRLVVQLKCWLGIYKWYLTTHCKTDKWKRHSWWKKFKRKKSRLKNIFIFVAWEKGIFGSGSVALTMLTMLTMLTFNLESWERWKCSRQVAFHPAF